MISIGGSGDCFYLCPPIIIIIIIIIKRCYLGNIGYAYKTNQNKWFVSVKMHMK